MPPVKRISSLYDSALECYGRHSISSLMNTLIVLQDAPNAKARAKLIRKRNTLLKKAKKYASEYSVLPTTVKLLKFVRNEIFNWNSINFHYVGLLSNHLWVNLWQVLRDFFIIHGNESVTEIDFSNDLEGRFTQDITLTGSEMKEILSKTVFQNSLWAKNLVSVKLPYVCNAEIVKALGCHCKNLQYLDISSCSDEGEGMAFLAHLYGGNGKANTGCPKLKTIVLPKGYTNEAFMMVDHVVKMIQFMPDLHVVRNVDTRLVAIKYKKVIRGKLGTMKLTEFEEWDSNNYRGYGYDDVNNSVGKIFPNVKRYLYHDIRGNIVRFSHKRFQGLVELQKTFPCLQVIEVHDTLVDLLEDINELEPMPSVKVLKLHGDVHVRTRDIQVLSTKLPSLENLVLECTKYLADADDKLPEDSLFPNLNVLELYRVTKFMNAGFLQMFLERCPSLTKLGLFCTCNEVFSLTEKFVEQLSTSMENLERLNINITRGPRNPRSSKLELTSDLVHCILSACPKIRFLGNLQIWSISRDEITEIKDLIKKSNWDLDIFDGAYAPLPCGTDTCETDDDLFEEEEEMFSDFGDWFEEEEMFSDLDEYDSNDSDEVEND